MIKKGFIPLLLTATLIFQSCKNTSAKKELTDENSVVLEDKFGETRLPLNPERVIPYNYGVLDVLDELGLGDRVIGFSKSNTPDYLKKYKDDKSLVDFGGTKDPNFEKINAENPDVIITEPRIEKDHNEINKIAPSIFMDIDYADYIGSMKENVKNLGKLFEIEAKADSLIKTVDKAIEANKAPDDSLKGLVVMFNNGKFGAFGPSSRYGFIYDDFNVPPISEDIEASIHGYNISSEYIQKHNPDILFVIDKNAAHHQGDINKSEVENDLIKETNAYKNDKIIYFTGDLWYYGAGGTKAMKLMAEEIGQAFE